MATDSRTTNRNYPLPYPSNLLAEDVVRLRDALIAIDTDIATRVDSAAVTAQINQAIQGLLDGAPGALDTLNELAAALGDDSNFASTVASQLAAIDGEVTTLEGALTALQATVAELLDSWTVVSTTGTAVVNTRYLADTSAGAFTLTLPATPVAGEFVAVADQAGSFATNNLTIARNGNNIGGLAEDLVADVDRAVVLLTYSGDASTGWLIK
jgi:hypothetical protein